MNITRAAQTQRNIRNNSKYKTTIKYLYSNLFCRIAAHENVK